MSDILERYAKMQEHRLLPGDVKLMFAAMVGEIERLRKELELVRADAAAGWDKCEELRTPQPMSTAPRDGTIVDLWLTGGCRMTDQWWVEEDKTWSGLDESVFTHWSPIPGYRQGK